MLRRVVRRDPRHIGALNDLAWVLAKHQVNGSKALGLVDQAISLLDPDSTLLDTREIAYLVLDRTDAGVADLKRAEGLTQRSVVLFHLAPAWEKSHRARDSRQNL